MAIPAAPWLPVELRQDPADDALAIRWCERGGPRVSRPQRTGFGMKLMEQLVTHDLRGQFELRFDPAGIECLGAGAGGRGIGKGSRLRPPWRTLSSRSAATHCWSKMRSPLPSTSKSS
ncbi:MAG: hypothetical protein IPK78_19765 [Rhodospirillales bacterium]|nr:hypothetical protein [Rhodospirillales bacterium]